MIRFRHATTALAVVVLAAGVVGAHPLQFSYIDVNRTPSGCDVAITVHAFDVAHDLGLASEADALAAGFPAAHGSQLTALLLGRFAILADGQSLAPVPIDVFVVPEQDAVVVRVRYAGGVDASGLQIAGWLFPYDPIHQTFVKILDRGTVVYQDILSATRARTTYSRGTPQSRGQTFRRFVASGIEHIAVGPDHLLFLIGLLLLGGTVWQLIRIVTGFTLAHSITLSLAALDVLSPPSSIVEPAIALSICFVGIDNLLHKEGSRDRRVWIAFFFGLVHGFGFASVLREIGLPRALLGWSLFAFNVGVEIGQLAIVAVVAAFLAWVGQKRQALRRRIAVVGSVLVVWAGFFWLVQRVFFV